MNDGTDGYPSVAPKDLAAVEAYLSDPVADALVDDLGRHTRALAAAEQIELLAERLLRFQALSD